jgi:hypothetical protein
MADKKLEYWYDWEIFGPDGSSLINLRESPPPLNKQNLDDVGYLCERIMDYPEATLMNSDVWYRIVMLRQRAFKDKTAANELREVCKAILGDGRRRKSQEKLEELKEMILHDIQFFDEILEVNTKVGTAVDEAISDYLTRGTLSQKHHDRRIREKSNYETVYYQYKRVYDISKPILSHKEIICFFEKAALNITHPNATIDVEPDNRLLTFVKKRTWYVRGKDMHVANLVD